MIRYPVCVFGSVLLEFGHTPICRVHIVGSIYVLFIVVFLGIAFERYRNGADRLTIVGWGLTDVGWALLGVNFINRQTSSISLAGYQEAALLVSIVAVGLTAGTPILLTDDRLL